MPTMLRANDKIFRIAQAIMKNKPIENLNRQQKANKVADGISTAVTRRMLPA